MRSSPSPLSFGTSDTWARSIKVTADNGGPERGSAGLTETVTVRKLTPPSTSGQHFAELCVGVLSASVGTVVGTVGSWWLGSYARWIHVYDGGQLRGTFALVSGQDGSVAVVSELRDGVSEPGVLGVRYMAL
jgi:hypothetical protein